MMAIKKGDRNKKASLPRFYATTSENQVCDDRLSDTTSSSSQIFSKSKARRLKQKMKAAEENMVEVTEADVELFREVKKSMFRSNGMKSKQVDPNSVIDDHVLECDCDRECHEIHDIDEGDLYNLVSLQKECCCAAEEDDIHEIIVSAPDNVDAKKDGAEEPANGTQASGESKKKKKKKKGKGKANQLQIEIKNTPFNEESTGDKVEADQNAVGDVEANGNVPLQDLNNKGELSERCSVEASHH